MIERVELEELKTVLSGVTVGVGSQIMVFENGATLLVQCPFKCERQGNELFGHGENIFTSTLLMKFLSKKVKQATFQDGVITLNFESAGRIIILPDANGLESYVLTTRHGISQVSRI